MAKCGSCGTFILLGGVRAEDKRFCNQQCLQKAQFSRAMQRLHPEVVAGRVNTIWCGPCPRCKGKGPVDVYKYYQVYSLLIFTRWTTHEIVACRSCGRARQTEAILFSLLCGWWGFPWGIFVTPMQIAKNLDAKRLPPDPAQPSQLLRELVMADLVEGGPVREAEAPSPSPPPGRSERTAPIQESDRVAITVEDRVTHATVVAVRGTHARCALPDGRSVWVPLTALTLVRSAAPIVEPEAQAPPGEATDSHAERSLPLFLTAARAPAGDNVVQPGKAGISADAKPTGDNPVPSRALGIYYAIVAGCFLFLPRFLFGMLFWVPLLPYFQWRGRWPIRAKKWLPHALVVVGLGLVTYWLPIVSFMIRR